ncbi:hypothetical protein BH09BAC5_BH09BAC5_23580 [soil metagenome]
MKTIFQYILASVLFLTPFISSAQDGTTGDLKVTVTDEKNQPMPGAIVNIVSASNHLGGATDLDGKYTFRALNPGTYTVQARMGGYKNYIKTGILVNVGQTAYADYPMQVLIVALDSVVTIVAERSPVEKKFSTIQNINAEELKHSANGRSNILTLIEGSSTQVSIGKGGQLVMRGAREGASTMYIDGEKVYGDAGIPGGSIEQVSVLSGGIPAAFGDMTCGVIIITTKTFETGFNAKSAMYEAAAEEEAAAKKAELEKTGKLIDKDGTIIEQQTPETPPAPEEAPATDGGGN